MPEVGDSRLSSDRWLIKEAHRRVAALDHGQTSYLASVFGADGNPSGAPVGQPVVDYLAGRTLASKLSLPALYSAAVWYLGWQEPLAWMALLIAALGLHVLLPHLYGTHYSQPLRAARQLATKHRLIVSPFLRITDWDQQSAFEKMAAERPCGRVKDALMFVGLLSVYSAPGIITMASNGYATCSLAPVVFGALLFVPLKAQAVARGQHTRRQWLDLAADVYCTALHWIPLVATIDSLPPPQGVRHIGEFETACAGVFHMALITVAKVLVLEKPVRWCVLAEASLALCPFVMAPVEAAKVAEAAGLPAAAYRLVPYVWRSFSIVVVVACVAWRTKSEAGYLQAFLSQEPEKCCGHMLRPRLSLTCKFPHASPADLSHDLRQKLLQLVEVEVESLDGFILPGCVFLSMSYRFGDVCSLEMGREAVLASLRDVATTAGLPWATMDAVVCVGDTRFTVQGGEVVKEEAVLSPAIVTVNRLALSGAKTLTLKALGLGSAPFSVFLRTSREYVALEVIREEAQDSDTKVVTVKVPEASEPGMAWLELHGHARSDCPILSEGFPLMFSPDWCVAQELSKELLHKLPTIRHVSSLLEDLAKYVCEGNAASVEESDELPGALLREVVALELPECFNLLAARRDVFKAAVNVPPGLLCAAVESGSVVMLHLVLVALDAHGLPFEPCRIPEGSPDGFSPLHLVASQGSPRMIRALLDNMPDAEHQLFTLQSGWCGRTPAELLTARWPWFPIRPFLQGLPSFKGQAVWGTDLVDVLSRPRTTAFGVAFPAAYSALLAVMGWREPLAWVAVATLGIGLHVVAPVLHRHCYVARLDQVRAVARAHKLLVTAGMQIIDPKVQQAYEHFELRRSSLNSPVASSLLSMAAILPAALLPAWQSWNLLGEVERWTVVQAAVALGLLTVSRWCAVTCRCRSAWQLVDLLAWNYCIAMMFCHCVYAWALEKETCVLSDELPFGMACFSPTVAALLLKMAVAPGSPSVGLASWLEPLLLIPQLYLMAFHVDPWCFHRLTGGDLSPTIGHARAAFWLVAHLCCVGISARAEAVRLLSFLAGHTPQKVPAQSSV